MLQFMTILTIVCLCLHSVYSAKILGVFPIPSISHQVVFQPIWKELSLKGHEVTVITPDPLKDKSLVNLTEIDVSSSYEIIRAANLQQSINKDLPVRDVVKGAFTIFQNILIAQLSHPEVQALVRDKSKHFDVVIVEFLIPAAFAFSARFNCPLIGITSLGAPLSGHDAVGNPSHPVLNPDLFLPFTDELGFYDRIQSTLHVIWYRYYYHNYLLPEQDKIAKQFLGEDLPYIGDIEKNVSILFLNENPIVHSIRPNVPAVIQLGSMHIKKAKPLPKDLKAELDAASEGVVYFSLGSNVKSANLTVDVREKIIGALSELPYKVLWKWEDDHLPGQPKNVIIRKWLPQQDVLAHPNVKVFVTQGGLQSMEESISKGVPLVGMPFFGDQPLNVKKMTNLGIAQSVDVESLTIDKLKAAIIEVAENPKYRDKVREISQLAFDVPMSGLKKAVWWTEYVIRHQGARHLRSAAVDMPWHRYLLLDVIGFFFVMAVIAVVVFFKTVQLSISFAKVYLDKSKLKVS